MTEANSNLEPVQSSAPLILWLLPLVGAVLVPGLWWTSADSPYAFRPQLISTMTLFVAGAALVVLFALSRGLRKRVRWSLGLTAVVTLITFQWRAFTLAGESVAAATGVTLLSDALPVLLAGGLLWLGVRLAEEWQFALVATIAVLAMVGVLATSAFALRAPQSAPLDVVPAPPQSPDVLLLVLDGYARADWLESEFGFDNSPFLEQLELRGFDVASEATANYPYTYASVASMLDLNYVFPPGEIDANALDAMRAALAGTTGLIPAFKQAGYETVYVENYWGGSQCGDAVVRCVRDGLVERSLWNIGQMTILAPAWGIIQSRAQHKVSADHLSSLGDYVSQGRSAATPRMTFAHIVLPHEPLLLDAECNRYDMDNSRRWVSASPELLAARRLNYAEQAQCVNKLVLDAIDTLVDTSPDAIVMITADHGPTSLLDMELDLVEIAENTIQERMTILSAYRLPGCREFFRPDLTPVNGTRIITGCALGQSLAPLPDHNFWANYDHEGEVIDITSRLQD